MDDLKLLSLTRIRLRKPSKEPKERSDQPERSEKRGKLEKAKAKTTTVYSGNNLLSKSSEEELKYHLPLLPTKRIPRDIFLPKKAGPPRRKHVSRIAWPEGQQYMYETKYEVPLEDRAKMQIQKLPKTSAHRAPLRLEALTQTLQHSYNNTFQQQQLTRQQTIVDAEAMIYALPLAYLFEKPELRPYAMQRACAAFYLLAENKYISIMSYVFARWKSMPALPKIETPLNEMQIGFLVISKALSTMVYRQLRRYMGFWAFHTLMKYDKIRTFKYNNAAYLIQHWYANRKILIKQPYRDFLYIVQMCLHRRRAIRYFIEVERSRRKALNKIRMGIAIRRRFHFAARCIQRIMRFLMLYRKTKFKLTRQLNARKLQRWRRYILTHRTEQELALIRAGLAAGGYTKVFTKLPYIYCYSTSDLTNLNNCISAIQRWYMAIMGKMDLFIKLARRRAAIELEKKRNKNATIIQNNYRAHLWVRLQLAAVMNNRARRIQRGFRAYMYRVWCFYMIQRRRHFAAMRISLTCRNFLRRARLRRLFRARKLQMTCLMMRKCAMVRKIIHAYREHVIWVAIKKEEMRQFFAAQRLNRDVVIASIRRIQRNWRQFHIPVLYSRHVLLLAVRMHSEHHYYRWKMAYRIQKLGREHIQKQRQADYEKMVHSVNLIWRLSKAYLLCYSIHRRVLETRRKRNAAAKKIQYNYRMFVWLRKMRKRFAIMKARIELARLRYRSAAMIQRMQRRVMMQYYMPLRVAARRQLKKRRERERAEQIALQRYNAACTLQKLFRMNDAWMKLLRAANNERIYYTRRKAAKRIQKLVRAFLASCRVYHVIENRKRRLAEEKQRREWQLACNTIGKFWRRKREIYSLLARFEIRKKILYEQHLMQLAREKAEAERLAALEEVKASEENMAQTIAASWKQGSDTNGRNYYYNYVTGESRWDPPENWVMKVLDAWIRNVDDRGQVYYYNQQTGESRWLPPCSICGTDSERWCHDCGVAYCIDHYESEHVDDDKKDHNWAVAEVAKEKLKRGEVYCIECKKRCASKVCVVCWDNYCDKCFAYVHHVGDLRLHDSIPYKRAKQGWACIKPRDSADRPYYVNGLTGETTYEKPVELMTVTEREYYDNFVNHRKTAEEYVKQIEKLQFEVEGLKYERDLKLVSELANKKQNAPKPKDKNEDVLNAAKSGGGGFSIFGISKAYKMKLMNPDGRRRGKNRSDYIRSVLENTEEAPGDHK